MAHAKTVALVAAAAAIGGGVYWYYHGPLPLSFIAQRYHIPLHMTLQGASGTTAYYYVGMWNGVPQVAAYDASGNLKSVYAAPGIAGKTATIGALVNGKYTPSGQYKIPAN